MDTQTHFGRTLIEWETHLFAFRNSGRIAACFGLRLLRAYGIRKRAG